MVKSYSRVQRGQVYWFDPLESYGGYDTYLAFNGKEYPSSVQRNKRPWMVVSNDIGNSTSPTCNIIPITTSETKSDIPTHVTYIFEGKTQTVLCEQIRTVDCLALKEYSHTVSDEILEKVEKALTIQFNIRPTVTYADFTLDSTIRHLEVVIANIISNKVELVKQELQKQQTPVGVIPKSQIEDAAINLSQMIEDLVGTIKVEDAKPIKEDTPKSTVSSHVIKPKITPTMSQVDKFNARYNKENPEPKSKKSVDTTKSAPRNKWTIESRQQYLNDCDKLSPQEVMKKYGFTKIQSVFQTKYLHRNALIKAGVIKVDD